MKLSAGEAVAVLERRDRRRCRAATLGGRGGSGMGDGGGGHARMIAHQYLILSISPALAASIAVKITFTARQPSSPSMVGFSPSRMQRGEQPRHARVGLAGVGRDRADLVVLAAAVAVVGDHAEHWKRTPNATGQGAIHVKTFVAKLRPDAMEYLDQQINEWLDDNPEYEVKFVTTSTGTFMSKNPEPALVLNVWV